ncbi:S1C family serine protease [Sporosarcina sp. G11-34]|uniref:S1C family serine protease n=1 Tax=Sporosarcina sp. G11-34 TaxID=2849605 RepID=UPI0022A8E9A0|nr:trypsin-like peptidase domain-containing protein [Sporosarcina sp. G11-34]MCZ2259196.1 trypsin-like peptidase domain-containing protein [Sporosarcina sp. G11-34]
MENETRNKKGNRFLSTLAAGVIGSVLTLGVVANTNFIPPKAQVEKPATENVASPNIVQTSANNELSLADMVEQSSAAIVGVVNYKSGGNRFAQGQDGQSVASGTGSGVIYNADKNYAYIVTNNHVIEGAEKIEVSLESGETTTAQLVGSDALSDLAVLKIDAKYAKSTLEFGDSDTLRAGDSVVAIGNPLGLDFSGTVTQGIVSAIDRSIAVKTSAGEWELNVIQTDAAINPGNSGGALLNLQGQVIGINSLKVSESGVEGLGFAIPSNEVVPLIKDMKENGHVERPYIGVGLANLNQVPGQYVQNLPTSVEGGVMVVTVDPESAAGIAGLQEEDIITAINGTDLKNSTELRKFLYSELNVGDKAAFTVYRGAEMITIDVTLTGSPSISK